MTVQTVEKIWLYIGQCVLSTNGYSLNVRIGIWMPDAISNVSIPRTQRFIRKWKTSGSDIAVIEKHQLTEYPKHEPSSTQGCKKQTSLKIDVYIRI